MHTFSSLFHCHIQSRGCVPFPKTVYSKQHTKGSVAVHPPCVWLLRHHMRTDTGFYSHFYWVFNPAHTFVNCAVVEFPLTSQFLLDIAYCHWQETMLPEVPVLSSVNRGASALEASGLADKQTSPGAVIHVNVQGCQLVEHITHHHAFQMFGNASVNRETQFIRKQKVHFP